jgi:hypothetical protein
MEAQAKQLEKDHKLSVKDLGLDSGIATAMTSIEASRRSSTTPTETSRSSTS